MFTIKKGIPLHTITVTLQGAIKESWDKRAFKRGIQPFPVHGLSETGFGRVPQLAFFKGSDAKPLQTNCGQLSIRENILTPSNGRYELIGLFYFNSPA